MRVVMSLQLGGLFTSPLLQVCEGWVAVQLLGRFQI